jgi:hypothetical protein
VKRLGEPVSVRVQATALGRPVWVDGRRAEAVRESWLVEDRWWTDAPLRRRYWELVLEGGRCVTVYRDLEAQTWYTQAG